MRRLTTFVALAVAFTVSSSEAAKPAAKPAGAGKPTITKTQTPKSGGTKSSTVKVSSSKGPSVKGASASGSKSVKPAKTTTQTQVAKGGGQTKVSGATADKSVKAQGVQAKADAKATKAEARTAKSGSSTTTTTSMPAIDFTATRTGQKLEKNPTLRSKIEAKLQAAGYTGTAYEAAYGFKNVGQLNAATNQVQNQGVSFDVLKVLMTGTYVDPVTHNVYRTQKFPDGTVKLVNPELATNRASTLSLGQAKQSIAGGAVMPEIVPYTATTSTTTTSKTSTSSTTGAPSTTTTGKSKPRKSYATVPTGGNF